MISITHIDENLTMSLPKYWIKKHYETYQIFFKKKSLYLNFKVDLGLSVKSLVNAPNSKIKQKKNRNITVLGDFRIGIDNCIGIVKNIGFVPSLMCTPGCTFFATESLI